MHQAQVRTSSEPFILTESLSRFVLSTQGKRFSLATLHVNFSFTNEAGENVIAPIGELSEVAQQCIAGLITDDQRLHLIARAKGGIVRATIPKLHPQNGSGCAYPVLRQDRPGWRAGRRDTR